VLFFRSSIEGLIQLSVIFSFSKLLKQYVAIELVYAGLEATRSAS
jgi:hypothetical protein